jgi:hypothetical protein
VAGRFMAGRFVGGRFVGVPRRQGPGTMEDEHPPPDGRGRLGV